MALRIDRHGWSSARLDRNIYGRDQKPADLSTSKLCGVDVEVCLPGQHPGKEGRSRARRRSTMSGHERGVIAAQEEHIERVGVRSTRNAAREARKSRNRSCHTCVARRADAAVNMRSRVGSS